MKRLLIFLLLFMAILLSGCSYINDAKNKTLKIGIGVKDKVMSFKESMQQYWACMDGCLFMQEITTPVLQSVGKSTEDRAE